MDTANGARASNRQAQRAHRPGHAADVDVHCYEAQKANLVPEKFQPGPAMLRANAFMAIAHGSSSLAQVVGPGKALFHGSRPRYGLKRPAPDPAPGPCWKRSTRGRYGEAAEGVEIHPERELPDRS